jgi:hypothetical protein
MIRVTVAEESVDYLQIPLAARGQQTVRQRFHFRMPNRAPFSDTQSRVANIQCAPALIREQAGDAVARELEQLKLREQPLDALLPALLDTP